MPKLPTAPGVYAVGYLVSRWYFKRLTHQLAVNLLIQVEVVLDVGIHTINQVAADTAENMNNLAALLRQMEDDERAEFNAITDPLRGDGKESR